MDNEEWDVVTGEECVIKKEEEDGEQKEEEATAVENKHVAAICVTAIFDNTASMTSPIKSTKEVMQCLMTFLKTAIESGQSGIASDSRVFVTLVGANDWMDGIVSGNAYKYAHGTNPVRVYVNEDECIKHKRLVPLEIDPNNVKQSFDTISRGIENMAATCNGGGDGPEDYGTAIAFVNDYIDRMIATIDGKVVATTLIVTDNANHGMSRGGDDSFPQGVSEDILKQMACYNKAFKCAYAPGGQWSPKPIHCSIGKLLEKSQVTWVLCGSSVDQPSMFTTWTGVLATMFEKQTGILLKWSAGQGLVKEAVVSIFCSYLAGESVPDWVTDEAAFSEAAETASRDLMAAATKKDTGIKNLSGDRDSTAEVISRLAIVADVKDEKTRSLVTEAGSDAACAAAYRSLSFTPSPLPGYSPLPAIPPVPVGGLDMARGVSPPIPKRSLSGCGGDCPMPHPTYRSGRSMASHDGGDPEDSMPHYRNLSADAIEEEPGDSHYRSLGGALHPVAAAAECVLFAVSAPPPPPASPAAISTNCAPSASRSASIVTSMRRRRSA
jgi:hypothetical protein